MSSHKKVDIRTELAVDRKSFWQRQEEEEKERIAEEKRRAAEKQAQFEKERRQKDELEAKQLAEKIEERDRLIEANRKAELTSSGSQLPSSFVTSSSDASADDDGRVGRRSELIRLERNQETQSLISKGLIKNKRAIFEQAQQQQQQQTYQPTLTRRSSGAMVAKRMNAFKSLDTNTSLTTANTTTAAAADTTTNSNNNGTKLDNSVNKLADSFLEQANIKGDEVVRTTPVKTITKQLAPVVLTKEVDSVPTSNSSVVTEEAESSLDVSKSNLDESKSNLDESQSNLDESGSKLDESGSKLDESRSKLDESGSKLDESGSKLDESSSESIVVHSPPASEPFQMQENGNKHDISHDVNGNSENSFSKKSEHDISSTTEVITNEELIMNGKSSSIKAIALFDYQAADNTEISFDPDDKIGHIQKVDPGWWHGEVMTGRFKGQSGLFPANYVQETES